ncbi:hypothetical protein FOZ62_025104 [Perkinsus olseni]|uniref:Uncharacterized protein n=1 Tax=Perkinsus olseni TaxID=32597 RepID=A0A7J6TXJ2_PEROL|nr:hypothetical protein FOZ62_025104 [Perkinsus olseni]
MEIAKIESIGSRLVVATAGNSIYMLDSSTDGRWRKRARVGEYEKSSQTITGIARLRDSTIVVMLANGTLHHWDIDRGSLVVSELPRSEGVQRYTGLAALDGQMLVAAVMDDHTAHLFVLSEPASSK